MSGGRFCLLKKGRPTAKSGSKIGIKELAEIFAVGVGGFSVMDNHLHLLLRLDPDVAQGWSDEDVVRRWGQLVPPRDKSRQPLPVSDDWVQERLKDVPVGGDCFASGCKSISWFMKCLKEPLARLANREDKAQGAFFESRFKSVAILDEESLLAGRCVHRSEPSGRRNRRGAGNERVHVDQRACGTRRGPGQDRSARSGRRGQRGGFARGQRSGRDDLALPDRGSARSSIRRGRGCLMASRWGAISLSSITPLASSARERPAISTELAGIFERPGSRADNWQLRMEKLQKGRLFGRFLATSQEKLQEVATHLGVRLCVSFVLLPARCCARPPFYSFISISFAMLCMSLILDFVRVLFISFASLCVSFISWRIDPAGDGRPV